MYGPAAIRRICERLARERDDARCHELIAQLRLVVDEDREELSDGLQFLASRWLRRGSGSDEILWNTATEQREKGAKA